MPKIRIRRPGPRDLPALARISYDAFPFPRRTIAQREELIRDSALVDLKDRLLLEVDGVPSATLAMVPFHLWLSGARFRMGGIGGVAVSPEARRAGHAQAVLNESLRLMRARGDVLSMLYPFRHEFYRNYGYGLVGERHIYKIPPSALPLYPSRNRVRSMKREEYPRVFDCYARLLRQSTAWVERPLKVWQRELKEPETRVFGVLRDTTDPDGELTGFLILEYVEVDGKYSIEVQDYGAEDEVSMQAILGFLAALREQIWEIEIFTAPDEHFAQRLIEPQKPIRDPLLTFFSQPATVGLGYMARVLDVPRSLALRHYQPCEPLTVAITVTDPSLPDGAARAVLALGPTGRSLGKEPAPAARKAGGVLRASLELPVDLFSQCFFGYLPWPVAFREGAARMKGDPVLAELDRAFKLPLPSLRDFF